MQSHSITASLQRAVRRLYSTFAQGVPGVGLLLLRLAVGAYASGDGVVLLRDQWPALLVAFGALHIILAALLIVGLWTPLAGMLLALAWIEDACTLPERRWAFIFASAIAVSAALVGPGRWSIDARMFGWKRVEISERRRQEPPG